MFGPCDSIRRYGISDPSDMLVATDVPHSIDLPIVHDPRLNYVLQSHVLCVGARTGFPENLTHWLLSALTTMGRLVNMKPTEMTNRIEDIRRCVNV